jgi:hypothetical protein
MHTMNKRLALVLGVFGATAGCYHYVPVEARSSPQGTPVRAQLDTLSAFELAQFTVNNIDQVEGEIVRVEAGDLILSATWLEAITGNGYPGNGWTVRIPEANVTAFEQRRLSWWRSALVIGGVAVGTWLGFDALGLTESGGDGGGGTGDPN